MRGRFLTLFAILAAAAVCFGAPASVAGQTSAKKPAARDVPRTPDGRPDRQGTYDLATLTPRMRPAGTSLWPLTNDLMYEEEYGRHEGNNALGNILRGARLTEQDEAAKRTKL